MEGDGPTGALVFPEYFNLKRSIEKKETNSIMTDPLHPMFFKRLQKIKTYMNEALECETLVMATILHPAFRYKILGVYFPHKRLDVKNVMERIFKERKESIKNKIEDL